MKTVIVKAHELAVMEAHVYIVLWTASSAGQCCSCSHMDGGSKRSHNRVKGSETQRTYGFHLSLARLSFALLCPGYFTSHVWTTLSQVVTYGSVLSFPTSEHNTNATQTLQMKRREDGEGESLYGLYIYIYIYL